MEGKLRFNWVGAYTFSEILIDWWLGDEQQY